jgi:hypothetical protein
MFNVYNQPCQNCLFSKDRIVSLERAKTIVAECLEAQTHFICHKSEDGEVCCHRFYKKFKNKIAKLQIFERLNMVVFKKQPSAEPLMPYHKMRHK